MGTPRYPRDLTSEWNQLKRDVKGAFTSANLRVGMSKIGASIVEISGELIMNAGAKLVANYDNGLPAMLVGKHLSGPNEVQGTVLYRPSGRTALWVWGSSTSNGFFAIYDQQGNIIISDDGDSQEGLARPYIPYNFVKTSEITNPTYTTSSSFVAMWTIHGEMQHPLIRAFIFTARNGSDNLEVRLRDTDSGAVIASTTNLSFNWLYGNHVDYEFGKTFKYDIEIRRTSGTSTGVGVCLLSTEGMQSI